MDDTLRQQLEESRMIRRPMIADPEGSGYERWRQKPIQMTRELPLVPAFDRLVHQGPGTMHIDRMHSHTGAGSIRLDFPTSTGVKNPANRAYAITALRYPLEGENLEAFNRISLWVYSHAPGFPWQSVVVSLHNEGERIMPTPGRFEGTHHTDIQTGEWNQVIWEIPDLYRDRVTGISVSCWLMGSPMNGAEEISLYVDDLRLEAVEPEKSRGFDLRQDAIAYCHSGYPADGRKQALVQYCTAERFALLDEKETVVYEGAVEHCEGGFGRLDFTSFHREGRYTIAVGALRSQPFPIGGEAYLAAAWKTLNFFYAERCGFDVPGIHMECHLDAYCRHPDGRTIPVHGGWHDAADLSQSMNKTADGIVAMLELAEATAEKEPALSERLLEEARWGLGWLMRTRFGDGYRHVGMIKGIWTKNYRGDKDDLEGTAQNSAFHNFTGAFTCAMAAPFYHWDSYFYDWCLHCAREDFAFAEQAMDHSSTDGTPVEHYALAASAAAMLYRLTGESDYLERAAYHARHQAECQQREPRRDYAIPLRGYFYEDRVHTRPATFFHRSTEQFFMRSFLTLLEAAPRHGDAGLWRECVEAYGDYLRMTAHVMEPYGILPAGIYELDNTDYSKIYHEGAKVGMPTIEEYNAQARNGIPLNDSAFLRRFPVAYQFRGFHATLHSKGKNAFAIGRYLGDRELFDTGARQLEYALGMNPFAMSTMLGEGYDYPPLYGGFAGQPVGAVPVGFETFENDDEPYMPMQNNCTYKEIWVCTTARVMWSIAEMFRGIGG